ncbi:MAG: hypothetical protein SFT90_00925 [Rickettsiales bacterium]|nr:hypothetical protein [Rickettsiales bacterium]
MFGENNKNISSKKEDKTPTPKLFLFASDNKEGKKEKTPFLNIKISEGETITISKIYRELKYTILNKIEEIKLQMKKNSKIFSRYLIFSLIALFAVFYFREILNEFHNFDKKKQEKANFVEVNENEEIEKEKGFLQKFFSNFYMRKEEF